MTLEASRRSFLRAVGLGAAALPFFKLLENSAVNAQAGALPLRFVGIYHPHGMAKELWAPKAGFDIAYQNAALSPFDSPATYGTSFKDKLLVIEGVDLSAGIESGTSGHSASRVILTGSGEAGTNASVDQFLAVERGLGASTRFASLVLAVGNDNAELGNCISYAPGGAPLPKIIDPVKLFDMVFADLVVGTDPAAQAAAERKRRLGQSVIDFIRGEINTLNTRLAPPEKEKLDQHLTSIRELEKRLETFENTCVMPQRPNDALFPKLRAYNGGEPYFDVITDLQVDLLAQALACDLTRFATLFLADLSRTGLMPELPDDCHNDVAHRYSGTRASNFGDGGIPGDPATWVPLATHNRYSYSKVARLMQKLHETSMLESTLIYVTSDLGDPNAHDSGNVPTLLAGGANGKFTMGRHIKLADDCPPDRYFCSDKTRVSNNKILVSICQAFDVPIQEFGQSPNATTVQGALSELV
jgi:hypothetical protein